MPGIEVASLYGVLSLDDRATGTLRAFDGGLAGLSGRLDGFGSRMQSFGSQLTLLPAPLIAGMGAGIRVASDFDSVMAEISARTGIVGADLQAISDFALQMGADTAFSAQQAADAFLQLLTSGQTAEEAFATLPAVLDAAAASGEDLGQTADVVTDIMAAFRLPVNRARYVVDQLARAAGASSADMASLGQGFSNVGGVAAQFNLDVEETAAVLAIFSENGIKGAEAGTQLRSMLTNMARDTESTMAAWASLGTSMFDAQGNMRPLADILDDITAGLEGMTDEERVRIIQDLAGSFGAMGLTALTSSIDMETMQSRMEGSTSAADVAQQMMNTFAGRVDALKGSVETLAITALTPFMNDVLTPLATQLTDVVNGMTEWAAANPEATNTIFSLIGATALLGGGMFIAGTIVKIFAGAIGLVSGAVGFLTSAAFLPLAGILLVVGGLITAYTNNWLGFRGTIDSIGDTIRRAITTLEQLSFILHTVNDDAEVVTRAVAAEFDAMSTNIAASLDRTSNDIASWLNNLAVQLGVSPNPAAGAGGALGIPGYVPPFPQTSGASYMPGSADRSQRASTSSNAISVTVMMPADALASPARAMERGREFGAAAADELRRRGGMGRV
jgi:TP901 family phage tail tape measure protein